MRLRIAIGAAVVACAATIGATAYGAFFSTSSVPSSSFSTSGSFCVSPGTQSGTDDGDTWVAQDSAQNGGTTTTLQVKPDATKARRAYIHFSMPAEPHNCTVTSATLTIVTTTTKSGQSMVAYRSAATWGGDANLTWASQPGSTGSPTAAVAATANGVPLNLDVTSIVNNLYSGSNTGFVIEEAQEGTGVDPNGTNQYGSRENGTVGNRPTLSVIFGG